jgi:hypothetical protein
MQVQRSWMGALALAALLGLAAPSSASTFARMGLYDLVDENPTIVVGEVVNSHSYWNDAKTFILTDYRIAVSDVLKGAVANREITVTVPGGKVGDLISVIVGGADLSSGKPYVLFLDRKDLLGVRGVLTVRDHCQGVFDLEISGNQVQAISQGRRHGLLPDAAGVAEPAGGPQGMPLATLVQAIRNRAAGAGLEGVKK